MKKTSQINLRLDPPTEAELTAVAETLGVSKSALVRRLTEAFLAEVKRTGLVKLSHEWTSKLGTADARTQWGDRKTEKAVSPPPPPPIVRKLKLKPTKP